MDKNIKLQLDEISKQLPLLKTKNGIIQLDPFNPEHVEWYFDEDEEKIKLFNEFITECKNSNKFSDIYKLGENFAELLNITNSEDIIKLLKNE